MTSENWRDTPAVSKPYAEVIGDPIAQSKSPVIHGHWLDALGVEARYRKVHVPPQELGAYVAARRQDTNWRGCNVTVPHKTEILDHVDRYGADVEVIGAANTIWKDARGRLCARNTDWEGFLEPLDVLSLAGGHAVIFGAGGAARGVIYGLKMRNIGRVTIVNRTLERGRRLLSDLDVPGEVIAPEAPLPRCALIVNATSLGMAGEPDLEIDLAKVSAATVIYDIVYTPLETGLLKASHRSGQRTIDGLGMFIGQARAAFPALFGVKPPSDDKDLRKLLTS
ncbi:MAG: shikimate dehydrogenase [Pacificimonas sp.]